MSVIPLLVVRNRLSIVLYYTLHNIRFRHIIISKFYIENAFAVKRNVTVIIDK